MYRSDPPPRRYRAVDPSARSRLAVVPLMVVFVIGAIAATGVAAMGVAATGVAAAPGTTAVAARGGPGGPLGVAAFAPSVPIYRWPLDGRPTVVRPFVPPSRPWLPGHRGVDLAAAPDVPVRAAGAGVVAYAGRIAGTGVVSVDHAGGLRTTYQPLVPLVGAGQAVVAGEPLGALVAGHAGCPVEACLHWGLRAGETYLDPLALLGGGRIRLLPLTPEAGSPRSAARPPATRQRRARKPGRRSANRSYSSARLYT